MALSQQSQMAVCILSAAGIISTVTFREPVAYGGTVTYEGYFQVLSLHGLFLPSENCGQRSGTGGLSISLCGAGGSVFGGCVAGFVRAATPVQVLVASFSMDGVGRIKLGKPIGTPSALRIPRTSRPRGGRSRSSRGTLRESSGGPGSPLDHNTPQGTAGMAWN